MPRQSRQLMLSALIWLAAAATVGGLIMAVPSLPALSPAVAWRQAHVYSLLIGWLGQFAVGVAYWMLPRLDAAGRRGAETTITVALVGTNCGLLLLWLRPLLPAGDGLLRSVAALALLTAAICWVVALLPRVLPWRELPRPPHE